MYKSKEEYNNPFVHCPSNVIYDPFYFIPIPHPIYFFLSHIILNNTSESITLSSNITAYKYKHNVTVTPKKHVKFPST